MEHLRQQLFQLGTVCLQLCNLMAQTTHCLHTINSSGHLSYLLQDCCCRHSVHKYADKECCLHPKFRLMREHHLISARKRSWHNLICRNVGGEQWTEYIALPV